MTAEQTSVKVSYESEGMTPEQIADDRKLDIIAVKALLMSCSNKYRIECGHESLTENELNFTDDDLDLVNEELRRLALYAESEKIRKECCMYIRDDKKGRKDVNKAIRNGVFDFLAFNERLQLARQQKQHLLPTIDIQPA